MKKKTKKARASKVDYSTAVKDLKKILKDGDFNVKDNWVGIKVGSRRVMELKGNDVKFNALTMKKAKSIYPGVVESNGTVFVKDVDMNKILKLKGLVTASVSSVSEEQKSSKPAKAESKVDKKKVSKKVKKSKK